MNKTQLSMPDLEKRMISLLGSPESLTLADGAVLSDGVDPALGSTDTEQTGRRVVVIDTSAFVPYSDIDFPGLKIGRLGSKIRGDKRVYVAEGYHTFSLIRYPRSPVPITDKEGLIFVQRAVNRRFFRRMAEFFEAYDNLIMPVGVFDELQRRCELQELDNYQRWIETGELAFSSEGRNISLRGFEQNPIALQTVLAEFDYLVELQNLLESIPARNIVDYSKNLIFQHEYIQVINAVSMLNGKVNQEDAYIVADALVHAVDHGADSVTINSFDYDMVRIAEHLEGMGLTFGLRLDVRSGYAKILPKSSKPFRRRFDLLYSSAQETAVAETDRVA